MSINVTSKQLDRVRAVLAQSWSSREESCRRRMLGPCPIVEYGTSVRLLSMFPCVLRMERRLMPAAARRRTALVASDFMACYGLGGIFG